MDAPLILVVDDTPDLAELYETALTGEGYRVVTAPDGAAALAMIRSLRPQLVVTDVVMPELDGLALLAELRHVPDAPPVIAVSGYTSFRDAALAHGAKVFLQKPMEIGDLLEAVRATLVGASASEATLRANAAKAQAARESADELREREAKKLPLEQPLAFEPLDRLVRWARDWFGVRGAHVQILVGPDQHAIAASSTLPGVAAGARTPKERTLCTECARANAPLVISDVRHHPVYAGHPEARAGIVFYAATPVRAPSGFAIGTFAVVDTEPRPFGASDLAVLEELAAAAARAVTQLGASRPVTVPIAGGLLDRAHFDRLVDIELGASARHRVELDLCAFGCAAALVPARLAPLLATAGTARIAATALTADVLGVLVATTPDRPAGLRTAALLDAAHAVPDLDATGIARIAVGAPLVGARAVVDMAAHALDTARAARTPVSVVTLTETTELQATL